MVYQFIIHIEFKDYAEIKSVPDAANYICTEDSELAEEFFYEFEWLSDKKPIILLDAEKRNYLIFLKLDEEDFKKHILGCNNYTLHQIDKNKWSVERKEGNDGK